MTSFTKCRCKAGKAQRCDPKDCLESCFNCGGYLGIVIKIKGKKQYIDYLGVKILRYLAQ